METFTSIQSHLHHIDFLIQKLNLIALSGDLRRN